MVFVIYDKFCNLKIRGDFMKKLIGFTFMLSLSLSLSGCTVNWFNEHYDVPWFVIAIPVAIIFLIAHLWIMSGTYICPECQTEIKPKWYQLSAYFHFNGKRLLKCPNCKKQNFCERK